METRKFLFRFIIKFIRCWVRLYGDRIPCSFNFLQIIKIFSANLTGCLLTHQFPIQTLTAIYYVLMDIGIIAQFFYYTLKNQTNHPLDWQSLSTAALVVGIPLTTQQTFGTEKLTFKSTAEEIGYVVGLMSSLFYLGSRLPQIIKNFKRGKTEGVHPFTFLLAVVANFAYAASVLLSKAEDDHSYKYFVMQHLPWLLGSLGTVALDLTILLQCLFLGKSGDSIMNKMSYDELDDLLDIYSEYEPLLRRPQ